MSGQLLNTVLDHYNLNRDEVFLTNACSCHYPETMKKLPAEAITACRPRLLAELQDAGVDTLVLMGNSATHAVLPPAEARKGITKLRVGPPTVHSLGIGSIEDANGDYVKDYTVVPTFHPAACLRNQAQFPLMLDDVAKAIAKEKPTLWYEPTIHIIRSPWAAWPIIREMRKRGVVPVVDTESGRDKDNSYGRDDGAYGRVLCVGVGPEDSDDVFVFSDEALWDRTTKREMREWFHETGVIMQNGKYDVGVLMSYLNSPTAFSLDFDTMLASYCLNETGGIHGLKYMGQEILGAPDWDSAIKNFINKTEGFGAIPRPLLYKYNAFDVHVTRLMKRYFKPLLQQQGLMELHDFLCKGISRMLVDVETRGIGFDLEISKEIEAELTEEIDKIDSQLPLNPRSVKQIKEYFFDNGVKDYVRDDAGEIQGSTDEDTLKFLLDRSDKFVPVHVKQTIEGILASRKVSKLRGTYVTGLQAKLTNRGTIHPSFLIHGTNTGRLSSRGPNSQNIPRGGAIKKQFIPAHHREGWKLVQADYSQAELRVLTWLAKEEYFRGIFNDPSRDIFDELCRSMFADFDDLDKAARKEIRTLVKTFAYGISYGRTAAGIAADPAFNMTVHEAEAHMKNFQNQIPNIMRYQKEQVIDRIHAGHDLINPLGRHKRFWLITDMNKTQVHNEAMAFMPQSTASDLCLRAAIQANKEGIYIVNLIHDAILFEAPADEADDQAKRVNDLMVASAAEVLGAYVQFATDYSVGDRWSDLN